MPPPDSFPLWPPSPIKHQSTYLVTFPLSLWYTPPPPIPFPCGLPFPLVTLHLIPFPYGLPFHPVTPLLIPFPCGPFPSSNPPPDSFALWPPSGSNKTPGYPPPSPIPFSCDLPLPPVLPPPPPPDSFPLWTFAHRFGLTTVSQRKRRKGYSLALPCPKRNISVYDTTWYFIA